MKFLAEFKKTKEEKKRNLTKGIVYLGSAGYTGQQTIRSGIPRLLGVRLESHSTSNKNAKEILKNGGILDPNKSGSGAIRALEANEGSLAGFKPSDAKGKIYITGIHQNANSRTLNGVKVDPKNEDVLTQVLNRKDQRMGYRGQSSINWNEVNKDRDKIAQLIKDFDNSTDLDEKLVKSKEIGKLKQETSLRTTQARGKAAIKALLPTTGRSLYIGGSDEYFNKNFKPDFDDVRAMYSENKIKVHGNRAAATLDALKREGNGSRLKGVAKLIQANPKRALAGLAILGIGGGLTANSAKVAYENLAPSDGKVKSHTRKNKSGKWSNVKSFVRDKK